jgi:integrase
LLGYAVRRGLIAGNPVDRLERGEWPTPGQTVKRVLSSDGLAELLDKAKGVHRPLIAAAIFTGLRQGELLGVTWADVDFAGGFVRVRKQLGRSGERVEPKTTQAIRDVVMMTALASILRRHKAASAHCLDSDFVFATREGRPLQARNVLRGFDRAANAAKLNPEGIRKLTFHDCRRTFASLLIAQGGDVVFVSRQLGHSDPSITLRVYADLFDRARHADAMRDSLDAAFGNALETSGGDRRPDSAPEPQAKVLDLAKVRSGGDS